MIVVRVELHSAITGKVTQLARMNICNITTDAEHAKNPRKGEYSGEVLRRPEFKKAARMAKLYRYSRLSRPVWDLVTLMLKDMGYGK